MSFALVVFILVVAASALILGYSLATGISPVPTSREVRTIILDRLPETLSGTVLELGAGWGTLARPLAWRYRDNRVIAYELSPLPWLVLKLRQLARPCPNLSIRRADFMDAGFADAALVVCYLYPGAMARLRPKFEAELRPGTWVVSNAFPVPGWQPEAVVPAEDAFGGEVYFYRIREKRHSRPEP